MDEYDGRLNIIQIVIIVLVVLFVFNFIRPYKYNGETAEFWFNSYDNTLAKYDELKECVETNPMTVLNDCL